jgi:hypothetical protein
MFSFLASIGYQIFKALEASGQARARRYLSLHKGTWQ